MRKSAKLITTGLISLSVIAPNVAFAATNITESNNINIDLEKRSILLGDTSKISIKFKENLNAKTITLNYICYDMPLSTELTYNESTDKYEGTINFDKSPELLYVWKIDNIQINNLENPYTISREQLQKEGVNVDDYDVTQEYIIYNKASLQSYKRSTSAPIKKLIGDQRHDTAIEISKEGWKEGADKVIIVNGSAIADGITATPLATTYDAPILLATKDSIAESTKKELKRLNPSEVIVIGGSTVVSDKAINDIKNTTNTDVRRLAGVDRHDTSVKIAQEIDKNADINKIYLANGYKGEIDALTIAAKAGSDKQPIILTHKEEIPQDSYDWLKNQDLKDAYIIGGEDVISTSVIHKANDITTNSTYSNRIYGNDRHETNAKVIQKFYPKEQLDAILVAKSDVLVDALAAGPLAAKLNSPILINPTTYVSKHHENNLKTKSATTVYQVGGGIKDSVVKDIAYKLSEHNSGETTIVIDAGHGGSDSGALNKVDKSIKEKDYTLDTAMGTTEYLRSKGVNVVMTRDTDKTMDLRMRTDMSNSISPDYLVSIHYNSYNGVASGTEIFYQNKDKSGGPSKTISNNILTRILEKYNLKNRGLKTKIIESGELKGQDYLHINRASNVPSTLVECAFIDNEDDVALLNTLEKRRELGLQIGKGIEDTLK